MQSNEKQRNKVDTPPVEPLEGEHQTYLRVAEIVLASALWPLKAREIVERAIERGLFGDHVLSRTPEKSMQARLSTDILNGANRSRFVRTQRGRFALRSTLIGTPQSSDETEANGTPRISEYVAERRVLRFPKEEVLCTSEDAFSEVLTFQGIDTDAAPILHRLLNERNVLYVSRAEAEARDDAKQFVTYVLVQCGQRLLFFRRSYLSRAAEFLRGSKCVGFGGHVSAADADILSLGDRGLAACARRELIEELRLPDGAEAEQISRRAEARPTSSHLPRTPNRSTIRLFYDVPLERLGVLNDDSSENGRRHAAVIYRAWLPEWNFARRLQKGESSIKGLGWIDLSKDKVDISDFEYWSQLCLRKFYPSTVIARSGFRILSDVISTRSSGAVIVAGRIGSGKTETAGYLSHTLGWPLLKSGLLLQELMEAPPITEIGRREFQARAFDFIRSEGGPERLAALIVSRVNELRVGRCIIDGIRHLATYEHLALHLGVSVDLLFVQTPPDVAYDMYRAREAPGTLSFSYREFLEIYDAPVESEIPSLGRKAQLYVYNSFGMDAFRRTLDEVAARLRGERPRIESRATSRGRVRVR
jgi:predicted NUDIX family phosphoesterase